MKALTVIGILLVVLRPATRAADASPSLTPAKLATAFPPPPGMLAYADGLDRLEAFDLATADAAFSKALEESPDTGVILLARGVARCLANDPERIGAGIKDLEAAAAAAPRDTDVRRMLALALTRGGRNVRVAEIHRFSSANRFDRLVQSILHIGGAGGGGDSGPDADSGRRKAIARVFVITRKQTPDLAKVLFARALQRRKADDLAGARSDLAQVTQLFPLDVASAFHYSAVLTACGDFERARQMASVALRREPTLVQGYAQRALAAARTGDLPRARRDLEVARSIDPADSRGVIAEAQKYLAEDETLAPAQAPAELLQALLADARAGKPADALATLAARLARAANAGRLHGEEVYQDKLRELQWAVLAEPNNADRLTNLGRFLLDEVDVRGEWIDPDQTWSAYRLQTEEMRQAELDEARRAFTRALAVDGKHVGALVGTAQIEFRNGAWGSAEQYARHAMEVRPNEVQVLDLLSRLMSISAGQAMAREMAALSTTRTEIWGSDHVWVRETSPSPAGYAYASAMDQQAGSLLTTAKEYTRAALKSLSETPQSYDYLGTYGFREKRYDLAAKAYERAVALSPTVIGYRYGLANAYAAQNDFDRYLPHVTAGRNLEQTSDGAQLLAAWQRLGAGNYPGADEMIAAALRIDPADARVPAWMAAVAEGKDDAAEALACYRAALALETARLRNLGIGPVAADKSNAPLKMSDVGRAVGLRMAVARLTLPTDPGGAAALCLENVAIETRLSPAEMLQPAAAALLPVANRPHKKPDGRRHVPRGGEVFRTNRGLAGTALYRAGNVPHAAEQFRRATHFGEFLVLAGAAANEKYDTVGWPSGADPAVARECLTKAGDEVEARRWGTRAAQSPPGRDSAPPSRTPPGAGPPRGPIKR